MLILTYICLYINKEEENENTIILDTYTIRGLLKDNYDLYRGVYLGYDPYELHNIDQKGKSYLKVRYNIKRPNLISLRKQHKKSIIDKSMNEEVIKPIRGRAWVITGGIIFNIFSFYFLRSLRHVSLYVASIWIILIKPKK